MHRVVRRRESGAVVVTVALTLLFLLGFMGVALDFSHLFVVKSELQTAMDSCALAAAEELDGQADAIERGRRTGLVAGNLNAVDFQSGRWGGRGQIIDADITFKDAMYVETAISAQAKYAQCQHTQSNVQMWLLHALGAFFGNAAAYPNGRDVAALAVATRTNAQTTCPIPLALEPRPGGTAPDYGYVLGEWIALLTGPGSGTGGEIGWANLDGSSSASTAIEQMESAYCGVKVGDTLGSPGVMSAIDRAWNYRFGIYGGSSDPAINRPDFTGYSYTLLNWPSGFNAFDGIPGPGADPTAENFVTKRLAFASCADTGTQVRGSDSCQSITGLTLNSFNRLAAPGAAAGGHRQYGSNRRLATVPVVNAAMGVIDYACMLMLEPLSRPAAASVQLEYRGNASDPGSPCTTSGIPGGAIGPLVPVLVQ